MFDPFLKTFKVPNKVCDNLIKYFNKNKKLQTPGIAGGKIKPNIKKSTDICFLYTDNSCIELKNYVEAMLNCFQEYKKTIPEIDIYCERFGLDAGINVQKYKKGEAFFDWHYENNRPDDERIFVFMTYLNDVKEGGETEWYFQKIKIKPKKGLTVFWPADWTYLHRGCPSKKETKYIATGWFIKI